MTKEHHLLTFLDVEVNVIEEHCTVCVYRFQTIHFENLISRFAIHLENDARIFATRRTNLLYIQFLQHLLSTCSLLTLSHIGRETADKLFQFLTLLFGFLTLILCLTQCQLRTLVPERIVTCKDTHFTKVDIYGLGAHGIKEVTVVTDHKHCLFYVTQIFFQPLHRVEVEVISRLIEQQIVGMSEQSFGQHYANLLVVGQFAHLLFVQILFYAEVAQHLCCIAFGLPTVHFGKLVFQFGCTITVFFAHLLLRIESLALFHIVPKRLMSHQDCIENAVLIVLEMVLIQYREPFTRSQFDSSFIRFQFAADGFEQR